MIDVIRLAVAIWVQLHETNLRDGRFRGSVVILESAKITKPANSSLDQGRPMNLPTEVQKHVGYVQKSGGGRCIEMILNRNEVRFNHFL